VDVRATEKLAQEAFEEGKSIAYNLPSHQVRDSHNK
jgi:hypothetical protein